MDFGFSRFLEMFEERFGRLATTILIGLIAAALVAYSLKVIIDTTIEFHGLFAKNTWLTWLNARDFTVAISGWIIGAILYFIFVQAVWRFYFTPRVKRATARFDEMMERHQKEITQIKATVMERHNKSLETYAKAEELTRKTEALLDKMEQTLSESEMREGKLGHDS